MKLEVLFEDNHLLVINKPINVPVMEDESNDADLVNILKQYLKDKYQKSGNVFVGLVHRLDRPVSGVMVFAKTSKAASRLSEQMRLNKFDKVYRANVVGKMEQEHAKMVDYMKKNAKTNTSFVTTKNDPDGKLAMLTYQSITYSYEKNVSKVEINLETGRSHQIRVQFASRKHPLVGDQRYNKGAKNQEQIQLCAISLSFDHPITKERLTFKIHEPF